MQGALRRLGVVAVALAAAVVLTPPALAHGGEQGLVVEPQAAPAGAPLSVRADLPTTSLVRLVLVDAHGTQVRLASVEDAADGHLDVVVTLPPDTAPGDWRLQAVGGGSVLAEQEVRVVGDVALVGPGEPADRSEPVVTGPGAALGALRPDAATLVARTASDPSPGARWGRVVTTAGAALLVACAAAATAVAVGRRRRRAPTRGTGRGGP